MSYYTPTTFIDVLLPKIKYEPKEIYAFFEMEGCRADKFNQVNAKIVGIMYKKDNKFMFIPNEKLNEIMSSSAQIRYKISKTRPFVERNTQLWFIKITTKKETFKGYKYCPNTVHVSENQKITKMVRDNEIMIPEEPTGLYFDEDDKLEVLDFI